MTVTIPANDYKEMVEEFKNAILSMMGALKKHNNVMVQELQRMAAELDHVTETVKQLADECIANGMAENKTARKDD